MSIDLLISTIGTGTIDLNTGKKGYRTANYEWKNEDGSTEEYVSKFFAFVLIKTLKPKKTVFLTTDAASKTLEDPEIKEELENLKKEHKTSIESVSIFDGKDIDENWANFQKIIEVSASYKSIAIDVTHGLRSLPIFEIASAMFLSEFKDIEVKHMYYGAIELANSNSGKAPVIDLKPVLDLYRWMGYARDLMNFGKADELVRELGEFHDSKRKSGKDIITPQILAKCLNSFSETVRLNKTNSLNQVDRLKDNIDRFVLEMENHHKPFASLFEVLNNRFVKHLNKPGLYEQRIALLDWNIKQGHFYQAISLARELLVSRVCIQLCGNEDNRYIREKAEGYLSDIMQNPDCKISALWSRVTEARNALMHSEFGRDKNTKLETVREVCIDVCNYLTQND